MAEIQITRQRRTMILVVIIIACIVSSFMSTSLTTALPHIKEDLGVSSATGQWLTSGYSLAMGIVTPLTAFFIQRFKTKRLFLTGMIFFMAGLIVCLVSPNFALMMVGRVLQACGNGFLISMSQVVILTIFPAEKRGMAMGWYGLGVGAAPVIAPTLSGVIVDRASWRYIFVIALVIMIIAFILAIVSFDNVLHTTEKKLDVLSFILSILAFGGITLGVGNWSSSSITKPSVWVSLLVGVVAMVFFIWRQLSSGEEPFLNVRTFKSSKFTIAVVGSMLLYFAMMGASTIMPLYIQDIMGRSATISGLITLPGAIVMAAISPFAGKIYDKVGVKVLFIVGSACLLVCCVGMCMVSYETPLWVPAIFHALRCASIGCMLMPIITWGTSFVRPRYVADATAIINSFRTIAGSIGCAVLVGIMTSVGSSSESRYAGQENAAELAQIRGMNMAFMVMALIAVVLLLLMIFGTGGKKKSGDDAAIEAQ